MANEQRVALDVEKPYDLTRSHLLNPQWSKWQMYVGPTFCYGKLNQWRLDAMVDKIIP